MKSLMRVLTLLCVVLLSACMTGQETLSNRPDETGKEQLRTDLTPLAELLPKLSGSESAEWMGGTLGDDRVPGPSTYWYDAVVTLDDATLAEVAALPDLSKSEPPELFSGLAPSMPSGDLLQSRSLNRYFATQRWYVTAWLSPEQGQVVLLIVGGN